MSIDGYSKKQKEVDLEVKNQLPGVLAMSEPDRTRCLFLMSYEYLYLEMEEEAFGLLKMADQGYFTSSLIEDISSVPGMDIIVATFIGKSVQVGISELDDGING